MPASYILLVNDTNWCEKCENVYSIYLSQQAYFNVQVRKSFAGFRTNLIQS